MENATKALLLASGILIGVIILSLGISLYASLSEYVNSTQEDMINNKILQFNQQFTKYINYNELTGKTDFTLTIQDIVTAANLAYENNMSHSLTSYDGYNMYVTINMPGKLNLEQLMQYKDPQNSEIAKILSNYLGKKYKCTTQDVKINPKTGRVHEVNFHEIP